MYVYNKYVCVPLITLFQPSKLVNDFILSNHGTRNPPT